MSPFKCFFQKGKGTICLLLLPQDESSLVDGLHFLEPNITEKEVLSQELQADTETQIHKQCG